MSLICQGFSKRRGISIMPGSSWNFHDEEVPYSSFGFEKTPVGQVLRKSLAARELTMYDLYIPLVENPNPAAVIRVENITGSVLLISSKMDTMWPSEPAARKIMERLREHNFSYPYQHLSYDYGSHLFVPVELSLAKFFVGDRGKYKELSRKARMDTGSAQSVEVRQYTAHIRPRGEVRKEIERNPNSKARRWVVEVTHSFFNRFRKLLVRFEKKAQNYLALIHFACAIIVWRKLIPVHR